VTLLAAVAVAGAAGLAAAASGGDPVPKARLTAASAPPAAAHTGIEVASPSGAVLAEMTRKLGTPRRVASVARKHARELAAIEAELARQRAARRAAAARRLAARRAVQAAIPNTPWSDPAAALIQKTNPTDPNEAQWLASGRGAWVEASGLARPPANAPPEIKSIIHAGNYVARSPYVWGGGHGKWQDNGYDCSGSVSYALASGGLLGWSQTSGQLMSWGLEGPGKWLTIYTSPTHVFMVVAGLRFDTSGRSGDHASRWQLAPRSTDGFAVRHYPGL
jgi:cell wall-associated NlpC family hydrolase